MNTNNPNRADEDSIDELARRLKRRPFEEARKIIDDRAFKAMQDEIEKATEDCGYTRDQWDVELEKWRDEQLGQYRVSANIAAGVITSSQIASMAARLPVVQPKKWWQLWK